ncbi:helix-turn-helix domain-containing protein [Inquilinus limosus]|uniref:helix-turn-helix domain-containing protein n=1 Tax=Inquilinus limosus TaxID=171674 RepID=UPI0003FF5741|nr:XRE family transcriptional regulator [Inquilinus limosus]
MMTGQVNIVTDRGVAGDAETATAAAVARHVAELRRARRLSLDGLARLSGVSKGMLVQIENARSNPSIATLCRVAAALGVSVAQLVDLGGENVVRLVGPEEAARLWAGPEGGAAVLLVGSDGPDMLELWQWELKPKERHVSDPHPAGTRELLHVTAGTLLLEVEGRPHEVPAGTSALLRSDRPHAYACKGARAVRFTMAVMEPHAVRRS